MPLEEYPRVDHVNFSPTNKYIIFLPGNFFTAEQNLNLAELVIRLPEDPLQDMPNT